MALWGGSRWIQSLAPISRTRAQTRPQPRSIGASILRSAAGAVSATSQPATAGFTSLPSPTVNETLPPVLSPATTETYRPIIEATAAQASNPYPGPSDQWIEQHANSAGLIDNTFIYMYDGTQNARKTAGVSLREVLGTRLVTTKGPAR